MKEINTYEDYVLNELDEKKTQVQKTCFNRKSTLKATRTVSANNRSRALQSLHARWDPRPGSGGGSQGLFCFSRRRQF